MFENCCKAPRFKIAGIISLHFFLTVPSRISILTLLSTKWTGMKTTKVKLRRCYLNAAWNSKNVLRIRVLGKWKRTRKCLEMNWVNLWQDVFFCCKNWNNIYIKLSGICLFICLLRTFPTVCQFLILTTAVKCSFVI